MLIWPLLTLLDFVLATFLTQFNFPEETFSRIGRKVAKICSCENFFQKNCDTRKIAFFWLPFPLYHFVILSPNPVSSLIKMRQNIA